jgi:6-phosphogluconolactonase (cycloisomerase 2 family)
VQAISLSSDGSLLAVTNAGMPLIEELWLFHVAAEGALSPVPDAPFLVGEAPLGLEISSQDYVYSPDAGGDQFFVFDIDGDSLVPVSGSPYPSPTTFPNEVDSTPDGQFVYTSHLSGRINAFSVGPSGVLSLVPGTPFGPFGSSGFDLIVSPDGRHVYMGLGLGNTVAGAEVQADGSLVALPGGPFPTGGTSAVNLAITPDGRFVFVCHVVSETVVTMSRSKDGTLTLVPGSSKLIGSDVRKAIATNDYLYVTDESSLDPGVGVMAYEINGDGTLTLISGSPFSAGSRPQDMVIYLPPDQADGDFDGDGDVDLSDFGQFQLCFTGPGGSFDDPDCAAFDFDDDGDVDLADFGQFQLVFTGPM